MEEWIVRQKQNPLEKAVYTAFGEVYDWGGDKVKVEMDGVKALVCLEHLNNMKKLLTDIVYNLPEVQQERFDVDLMLDGYCSYLKYRTKEQATICVNDHEVYEAWYKEFCDTSESCQHFSELFQNLQIRTSSEAIAETVGSIMGNHCGKGRFLTETNFSIELYLQFNLGPLHLLHGLAEEIFNLKKKEYLYRKTATGQLSTYVKKLTDSKEGAAVATYRRLEEENSHLPTTMW